MVQIDVHENATRRVSMKRVIDLDDSAISAFSVLVVNWSESKQPLKFGEQKTHIDDTPGSWLPH